MSTNLTPRITQRLDLEIQRFRYDTVAKERILVGYRGIPVYLLLIKQGVTASWMTKGSTTKSNRTALVLAAKCSLYVAVMRHIHVCGSLSSLLPLQVAKKIKKQQREESIY